MYNRKKKACEGGKEMIVLWIITLCMTAIFCIYDVKNKMV